MADQLARLESDGPNIECCITGETYQFTQRCKAVEFHMLEIAYLASYKLFNE